MGFIAGGLIDFSNSIIGHFKIHDITSRSNGIPNWVAECNGCGKPAAFTHNKLQAALNSGKPEEVLVCASGCFRRSIPAERLSDAIRIEQQQKAQQEQIEREQREREAQTKNAESQKKIAIENERARWMVVAKHQLNSGVEIFSENWIPFESWLKNSSLWKEQVLDIVKRQQEQEQERKEI
jgi:hypothetical protein